MRNDGFMIGVFIICSDPERRMIRGDKCRMAVSDGFTGYKSARRREPKRFAAPGLC